MSRGCIWTLVGIGVALILLIFAVIVVPLFVFDIVTTAPRVPVATFVTPDTVLALRIDPNRSGLPAMVAEGARQDPDGIKFLLPHEVGVVVDIDDSLSTRTATFILSPRHLGPAFKMFFGNPDIFMASEEMEFEGIDTWDTESVVEENGALIVRGHGTIDEADRAFVQAHWPSSGTREPVTLEGNHLLELFVTNHDGRAALIQPNLEVRAEFAEAAPTEALPAEAPMDEETPAPETSVSGPDDVVRDIVFLRLTADFAEPDLYTFRVDGVCPDSEAAARVQEALTVVSQGLVAEYESAGVALQGEIENFRERVSGELRLTGVRPLVVRSLREKAR